MKPILAFAFDGLAQIGALAYNNWLAASMGRYDVANVSLRMASGFTLAGTAIMVLFMACWCTWNIKKKDHRNLYRRHPDETDISFRYLRHSD